ncbi:MAG: DUF4031 domain-containing protein [Intrasporangium sp.]|uniref:DUF4031 domain-containing protein n=1 Tax=Intrasporangium sp. TaxID=1925024 RepID=UPI002649C788|nr:DUF4031 domain-containing protein [Intrasporangium sp.]MDN5797862.1 DUF4031 domain-containing protein [Intrasporangium sp.]
MTVWIDQPSWPAHGRHFAHLVSDASYHELHEIARRAGLPPRAFDGDHYDVPDERWHEVVAAGATPTTGPDLVRRLNASGLRLRKRKGDRGVARRLGVSIPGGSGDVDLILSPEPVDAARVMGSMLFVRDTVGSFAAVYSIRRDQWGSPGGGREPGEAPLQTAVRETYEETGLLVEPHAVLACGYERFRPAQDGLISASAPYLQAYRTTLSATAPALTQGDSGIRETRWMTPREYAAACSPHFWWPLAVAVFPELGAGPVPQHDAQER